VVPPLMVLGRDVPVASAVLVRAEPVEGAVSEKGQWKGIEEAPVPGDVGPGPW
jgi:hypothetical protein